MNIFEPTLIVNVLLDWLAEKSGATDINPEANFFEEGILDSFDVIEFIEFIEQKYELNFSEENFQDRRFATAMGLSEIIGEIMQNSKS